MSKSRETQELQEFLAIWAFQLRKWKGITQEEMAGLLSVSSHTYSDLETGKRLASTATLLGLLYLMSPADREEFFIGYASLKNSGDKPSA